MTADIHAGIIAWAKKVALTEFLFIGVQYQDAGDTDLFNWYLFAPNIGGGGVNYLFDSGVGGDYASGSQRIKMEQTFDLASPDPMYYSTPFIFTQRALSLSEMLDIYQAGLVSDAAVHSQLNSLTCKNFWTTDTSARMESQVIAGDHLEYYDNLAIADFETTVGSQMKVTFQRYVPNSAGSGGRLRNNASATYSGSKPHTYGFFCKLATDDSYASFFSDGTAAAGNRWWGSELLSKPTGFDITGFKGGTLLVHGEFTLP